jgi:hypothetical protein
LEQWVLASNGNWPRQIPPSRRVKNTKEIKIENSLGVWINGLRKLKKENKIPVIIEEKLNNMGFIWDGSKAREKLFADVFFEKLKEYLAQNKSLPNAHSSHELVGGLKIRVEAYKSKELEPNYLTLLNSYNFESWIVNLQTKKTWECRYYELVEYYNKNNKFPSSHKSENNPYFSLAIWYFANVSKLKKELLSPEKALKMSKLNIIENKFEINWNSNFKKVKEFWDINKKWPSQSSNNLEERNLCYWLMNNKNWYRGNLKKYGEYPQDRKIKLESIGFELNNLNPRTNKTWAEQFDFFVEYYIKFNRTPSYTLEYPQGNFIGSWYFAQKSFYKNNKLSTDKIKLFDSLGIKLALESSENFTIYFEELWNAKLENLVRLIDFRDSDHVESLKKQKKEYAWFKKQLRSYKKGELSTNRIINLEKNGIYLQNY